MATYATEQEAFWAGDFGTEYIQRNVGEALLASNLNFFSRILDRTQGVKSVTELGANVGMNLRALRQLLPGATLTGVEINPDACRELRALGYVDAHEGSLLSFRPKALADLSFVKGVLIHIAPDKLAEAYATLDACAARYCVIAEYYNPSPVTIPYRGHTDRLFKRDFAGEFLEQRPGWALRDYGFCYRRDPVFPQDDITWFLMERGGFGR